MNDKETIKKLRKEIRELKKGTVSKNKVYCGDCGHLARGFPLTGLCWMPELKSDTHVKPKESGGLVKPKYYNSNNDCRHWVQYTPPVPKPWWRKL